MSQVLCDSYKVHVDGAAVRSCQNRMGNIDDGAITTIVGLAPNGMHSVQVARRELDVAQCGYCRNGHIMQVATLLAGTPNPPPVAPALTNAILAACGKRIRALSITGQLVRKI